MDNEVFYTDYELKFNYILIEFQNDFKSSGIKEYIELLNNEDIISSLFKDTAKNIFDYSDIYDVDIKIIDDIKILSFLAINIYKIIDKNILYTKKYIVFNIMLKRFLTHIPNNKTNKILIKLQYMFKNLSSYDELINNNGKFGIFQILKSIYNAEKDSLYNTQKEIIIDDKLKAKMQYKENALGEVYANDWIIGV